MVRHDLFLGQHPPDLRGAVAEPLQRLKLAVVVVGQGQCLRRLHADLIARQTGKRIGVQCRQPQHLLYVGQRHAEPRSEEHTSELQSLMRISYAVFCLKKKKYKTEITHKYNTQYIIKTET